MELRPPGRGGHLPRPGEGPADGDEGRAAGDEGEERIDRSHSLHQLPTDRLEALHRQGIGGGAEVGEGVGVGKRPVAAGRGSGDLAFDIDPGKPDNSILLYRAESTEPGVMMPELGRSQADRNAVGMLREWIAQMR